MSYPDYRDAPGFHERSQQPIEDIPTDTEEFLRWGTTLDPGHPYKYELSNGKVSRTMIQVSRAHWEVTANILAELFSKLDRTRFRAGPTEFVVRTGIGVRYPDVVVDRVSSRGDSLACEAPIFLAEVLSPSTEDLDFTVKLREYGAIASVQTYLICSHDEPRVWVWQRGPDRIWPESSIELAGRVGEIRSAGAGHQAPYGSDLPGHPRPAHSEIASSIYVTRFRSASSCARFVPTQRDTREAL